MYFLMEKAKGGEEVLHENVRSRCHNELDTAVKNSAKNHRSELGTPDRIDHRPGVSICYWKTDEGWTWVEYWRSAYFHTYKEDSEIYVNA